jgi:hypothetical protein
MSPMKLIKDILRHKNIFSQKEKKIAFDEKTIIKVFQETTFSEIKNLFPEDLRNIYRKNKTFHVKTAHPAIASEIWKKREQIINKTNHILGSSEIKEIKVK